MFRPSRNMKSLFKVLARLFRALQWVSEAMNWIVLLVVLIVLVAALARWGISSLWQFVTSVLQ